MGSPDPGRRVDPVAHDVRFAPDDGLGSLVAGALAGHEAAWDALVARLHRVVWKTVNMMTTDPDVRDDAFAATWLRLAERLDTIREPEKLPGWLVTTATNEVRQIVRRRGPAELTLTATWGAFGDQSGGDLAERLVADDGEHSEALVRADDRQEVRAAFARLDEACRQIIAVLVLADPPLPYDEASALLGRPIGSLGPTRGRCLEKMKQLLVGDGAGTPGGPT
jgi:RNA polymerase sigma factor (sigma-70 family)